MVSCGLHSFSGNVCIQVDMARFRELSQLLSNSVLRQSLSLNRELMYLLGWLAVKAPQIKFLEMKVSCQS